jgi:hypothetical protein
VSVGPAPVDEPFTGAELVRDFGAVGRWAAELWQSFDTGEFFQPLGDAWSPADNLRHLIKSNRPVARALGVPRLVLLLRFGFARRPSRSYSALRATYHQALAAGLRAGDFTPRPLTPGERTDEQRREILARWSRTLAELEAAIPRWSERALGHLRLPHPGLGLLTVREMLLFTLYHNTHHVLGVARLRRD